ncbi:MAG: gliding motility-associated C-terminal domain-containing protein [Bacteroidales bacterium]|nr:gliding motility-associated C-terminal domain-containing protein [Bacteroidales bacterium]
MMRRIGYMGLLWLLLSAVVPAVGQVDYCYTFEDGYDNSRPMYWSALPNLDYHYVGVQSHTVHTGSKAMQINGCTCYAIMPDEGINYSANGVWITFWYYPHLNPDYLSVGYMTDASDSTTFHLLATAHGWMQQWHFFAVDLSSVPTGARIAFFGHDLFASDGTFFIDDIHLTSFPCAAWGLRVAENRADSVRFEWQRVGNALVHLDVGGYWYYMEVGDTSLTVPRNSGNAFSATLYLDGCQTSPCVQIPYSESVQVLRYREGSCPDITDYNSSMAVPYHGTYIAPHLLTGTYTNTSQGVTGIYAGSHAINTTPGSDGGGMMVFPRTIPPGDTRTLRLGNRLGDWETDAMLYTITVDTNEADLLVMKYTVAMAFGTFQGPEVAHHNDTLHPAWFSIELLDDTMAQMQPEACNRFYIDMWDNTGWDEMNSMYRRRNFTGIAFDFSAYHGQRVRVRVTAADGVVNNRWCYGYYNFECLKRHDAVGSCESDSMTLVAPYGFRYRWYRDGTTATVDTVQSITVAADGTLYHCDLIDRFNPACICTISRRVLAGPYAEVCDTVVQNQLPHIWRGIVFNAAADTTITIPASSGCDTTLHYVLHVWPNRHTRLERRFCPGQWPVEWEGHTFLGPDSVTVWHTDIHGADSTVMLVAVEAPVYEIFDTIVICPGSPFVYGGIDYGGPVAIDTLMTTVDGCDSLLHIALVQRDSAFQLRVFHSVDLRQWADTVPIVLCSGQTLHVVDSSEGSASWHWLLADSVGATSRAAQFTFDNSDSILATEVTLAVVSFGACADTLRWPIYVFPNPKASFVWDPARPTDMAPEVQLINYSKPGHCSWLWTIETTDGSTDSLTDFSPFYRWSGTLPQGNVAVTLAASLTQTIIDSSNRAITHTCVDTATHTIQIVTSWLEFPNLVTPNGDGQNDRWEVKNLVEMGLYPMNEVWIFNQWGVQVFHARDVRRHEDFWDPNATSSPDGTYYFRFQARSPYGIVRRNGVIEVLR